jgi:hypothetical protein
MAQFLTGAMAMAFGVIGLYFFKFWKRTHDRLFFVFGCSFWLLAVTRIGLVVTNSDESHAWYGLRLVAFLLILYAIWDKNRPTARRD